MKMIKQIFVFCAAALLLTACGSKTRDITSEAPADEAEAEQNVNTDDQLNESLNGLIKDEYAGLEITAAVLERKAILPGDAVPIAITITNNGDKTIIYNMGSGSFETPQAIQLDIPELQPILARDHLGIATLDMRSNELLPGESIEHTLYIRTIEPNENFNDYTYNKWQDEETYIGDIAWNDLQKEHNDLTPAATGSYEGTIYFLYYINEGEQVNPTLSATGYSTSNFTISVTD